MSAPVRRFRLSSIFRWALLVLAGGMPAPAHGTTLELGAPPSAAVVVSGPLGCPDAAAVGAALKGLLPPRQTGEGAGDGPDVLQLSPRRDGLDVRLYAPGGALVGEKSLVTDEACDERAQTVAVLVAAWETRWRAGSPSALPRPSPAAAAETPRPPSPRLATPVPPVPTDPPGALVETVTTQHQAVPLRIEMRAGLLMSIAGGSVAPALSCDLAFRRRGLPFALAVGAYLVAVMLLNDGAERSAAIRVAIDSLPWLGVASTMSVGVSLTLRWLGAGWRAAGLGFAAAVVSGTVITVLHSLLVG